MGYFKTKILEYEFKDIFPMVYDTPARKLNMNVPKAKSEWTQQYI